MTIVNGCQPLSIVIRQYSSEDTFTEWKDGFAGEIFFKNGLTSSWGVLIGYLGNSTFNSTFKENKRSKDNNGRILIIDVEVGDDAFFLINLFYSKPEVKELQTLSKLDSRLYIKYNFSRRFQPIYRLNVRKFRKKSIIKNKSISNILQICEKFDLKDIWRIRNPLCSRYIFIKQNHFSGFIQSGLDFFFISNSLQESVNKFDILPFFSSDHSPIFMCYKKCKYVSWNT